MSREIYWGLAAGREEPLRKILLMASVSLDGFFEGPDGELGWLRINDELQSHLNEVIKGMSAALYGRAAWEMLSDAWPKAGKDPSTPELMRELAAIWREMPKYVFSRTLTEAGLNATIVREVVPEEIQALKAQPGEYMQLLGADLAGTCMRLGLVDEYRIYVHPVLIGQGRPLFEGGVPADLERVETQAFSNGVVLLRYRAK